MPFRDALFGFLSEPVRQDVGKNHHVAGICLKIMCWVTFVGAIVIAALGLLFGLLALLGAALWTRWIDQWGAPSWLADLGAAAGVLAFVFLLFAVAFVVAVMGLYLWWTNHTFHVWNQNDPSALVWANVFAGVTLGVNVLGMGDASLFSFQDGGSEFQIGGGISTNIIAVVLSILILIFANMASSQGELGVHAPAGGPAAATSEAAADRPAPGPGQGPTDRPTDGPSDEERGPP